MSFTFTFGDRNNTIKQDTITAEEEQHSHKVLNFIME